MVELRRSFCGVGIHRPLNADVPLRNQLGLYRKEQGIHRGDYRCRNVSANKKIPAGATRNEVRG